MPKTRSSGPLGAALPRLAATLLLLAPAAPAGAQQGADGVSPARVSASEFRELRRLDGTWRGRMPDGKSFYERYSLVNDSTFAIASFRDSTLASPTDIGRVALRGGAVYREEATGERLRATRLDASGITFGTRARGFTWAPRAADAWTATIHRVDGSGAVRDIVYPLERFAPAPAADEREAVRAAVLDYVDALYEVDPTRVERSVHPELAKRGFFRPRNASSYDESKMSYEQLHALAGRWNSRGGVDARTAVKEIVVYDVLDQTATAKLTAQWGIDYLHLARYDGRWKIVNVLWQSPPSR